MIIFYLNINILITYYIIYDYTNYNSNGFKLNKLYNIIITYYIYTCYIQMLYIYIYIYIYNIETRECIHILILVLVKLDSI